MPLPAYEKLGAFYLGREVDASTGADKPDLVMYDSRDLTTHAVCVGMTGSGKTGLCISLLEEAAIDGVPALVIDPKGDLANLLLTFPNLAKEDFKPWVDPADASRKGVSVDDYAASVAETWRKGLGDWQQDGERIQRLRDAAEFALYTPGSRAGNTLSLLRAFTPPDAAIMNDQAALKDSIGSIVAGLLGLIGINADPLKSRECILLSSILEKAWRAGESLDLAGVIGAVQKPAFDKVGVFDLETFYPAKERLQLAMALNNVLAAPGFDVWLEGQAIDLQRLLFTESGKPRVAIVSIAHLNDAERMFVVTLLMNEAVSWMRRQSGTGSLRALIYMDEIFGYFPPSAMPPSKVPMLTLMKQARAFGIGVVLCTQNPVDLDYKGLSNAGTWFIGRLQTERDKARVIEGLLAAAGSGLDEATIQKLLSQLGNRVFLMRNVHDDAPVLMRTRWCMSYLRGPLTLNEIERLPKTVAAVAPAIKVATSSATGAKTKSVVPSGVTEYFAKLSPGNDAIVYAPYVLATARLHFVDASNGVDAWVNRSYLTGVDENLDWSSAQEGEAAKKVASNSPQAGAGFVDAPAALTNAKSYAVWTKQLSDWLYQSAQLDLLRCAKLKVSSTTGESEGDFRSRIALALREKRDAEVDKLRKKYAPKITTLTDQIRKAEDRIEKERSQLSQQKMSTAISVGSAILGAFLGRKAMSAANLGRAGTALRGAGNISKESADVVNANESLQSLQQRLSTLQADMEGEVARLQSELDSSSVEIETITLKPRKSDIAVVEMAVLWMA
jgi:hypothetical protein